MPGAPMAHRAGMELYLASNVLIGATPAVTTRARRVR
jgi:hypothetical protein